MRTKRTMTLTMTATIFALSASASTLVYVVTGNQQFGTVDLATGSFTQIGPNTPEADAGLVPGPNGSLLTLTSSGNLDAINPGTGVTTLIGPTGLGDCSLPTSPCGPTSANALGEVNGKIYATDYQQNLYSVNPSTGQTTLIGQTGIPPVTFVPFGAPNPDGTFNLFGGNMFSANGSLYATFDTGTVDFMTGVITPVIPDELYQIDPTTGQTTAIAATTFALDAITDIGGTIYGFKNNTNQLVTLDLTNGNTSVVGDVDPNAGLILGAAPLPEPASIALVGVALAALTFRRLSSAPKARAADRCP